MTEEQVKLFREMVHIYYHIIDTVSEYQYEKNEVYEMLQELEKLTEQPVTDWT